MIVGVLGAGGGVGTSTFALLLAAALRESRSNVSEVLLVEADPSGGVLMSRFDLGVSTGVGSWASVLVANPGSPVSTHGREIVPGLRLLAAPVEPRGAERALTAQTVASLAQAVKTDTSRLWVVDLGRGGRDVAALVEVVDCLVVVSGDQSHVVRLNDLVATRSVHSVVVLAGSCAWPASEVQRNCGATAVVSAPDIGLSPAGVLRLVGGKGRRMSKLWASVLECRDALDPVAGSASHAEGVAS